MSGSVNGITISAFGLCYRYIMAPATPPNHVRDLCIALAAMQCIRRWRWRGRARAWRSSEPYGYLLLPSTCVSPVHGPPPANGTLQLLTHLFEQFSRERVRLRSSRGRTSPCRGSVPERSSSAGGLGTKSADTTSEVVLAMIWQATKSELLDFKDRQVWLVEPDKFRRRLTVSHDCPP